MIEAILILIGIAMMLFGTAAIINFDLVYWTEGINPFGMVIYLVGFVVLWIGITQLKVD